MKHLTDTDKMDKFIDSLLKNKTRSQSGHLIRVEGANY